MVSGKIAVVGCGRWGQNHVRVLSEIGSLAGVYDIDSDVADRTALKYDVPVIHIDEIYCHPGIDGVVIAVPASQHAALAKRALESGKHVFVEKPLALKTEDALCLNELSQKLKRVFMVGHLLQYHSAYRELKKLVLAGTIGNVQHIYSKRLNLSKTETMENVVWSLAPHDISMILDIVGELPEWVSSEGDALLNPALEDIAEIHMAFKNGVKAHVHVSWLHPFKETSIVIIGETGMLVFDDMQAWEKKVQLHPHQVKLINNVSQVEKGEVIYYPIEAMEPLKQECLHFIQCIQTNQTPKTDGAEGTRVVQVLDAAQRSLKTSERIQLDCVNSPYYKHETAFVDEGCRIGGSSQIWRFSHLMTGTVIGDDCIIGEHVIIEPNVTVGNRCKIQDNVKLHKGVTLEDGVVCGMSCVFTNRKEKCQETHIGEGVTIEMHATIVRGVRLGAYSFIGTGAVIVSDVKPHALMVGNPGRQIGWVNHHCNQTTESKELAMTKTYDKSMPMPFNNLKEQQNRIRPQIDAAISRVLAHGSYILGPDIAELEGLLSKCCGAKHAIGCSSGTDALLLGLMAKQIGPGDAIFVPSFTFAATAEVVARVGATVVFIDSLPDTYNMDPQSLERGIQTAVKHGITPTGIIAVDLFGQPADYNALQTVAKRHGLWIICDASQSFGASYEDRQVGTIGDLTTTSFFPAKPLGCYGDGGAVFTDDDELAAVLRSLRNHGIACHKYDHVRIGSNSRLDTIQAAILIEKLKVFPDELVARQHTADLYSRLLKDVVNTPYVLPQAKSSWAQYTIVLPKNVNRNELMENLQAQGIPTMIYYIRPMHMQQAYKHFLTADECALPVCEDASCRVLSLPMSGYVTDQDAKRVCDVLKIYLNR